MDNRTQDPKGKGPSSSVVHEPYAVVERFRQLDDIDNEITSLLSLAHGILVPLSSPVAAVDTETVKDFSRPSEINTDTQVTMFRTAMDGFLTTLHSVDVRLKRQIWALEEAGIVSLKESKVNGVSLGPNGVGDIGSLDVGWLSSRSNKVDRDMEAELWTKASTVLESLGQSARGEGFDGMDVEK